MKTYLRILSLVIFMALLIGCTGDGQGQNGLSGHSPAPVSAQAPASGSLRLNATAGDGEVITMAGENGQRAPCAYAQDYWKTHLEAWPVQELVLGDVTYQQEELLAILETPPRGNTSYMLAHQVIAAKLSAAQGAPAPTAIRQADSWLAQNPLGGAPAGRARVKGLALARVLAGAISTRVDCDANGQSLDILDVQANDYCSNGEAHPHALTLAQRYDISYEEIMQWSCAGFDFDDIERAYDLSLAMTVPVQRIFDLRTNGLAWSEIAQTVHPAAQMGTNTGDASEGDNVRAAADNSGWVSTDDAATVMDAPTQDEQLGNGQGNTTPNDGRENSNNNGNGENNTGHDYGKENNPGQSKAKGKE